MGNCTVYDAETIHLLRTVLEEAWETLQPHHRNQTSKSRLTREIGSHGSEIAALVAAELGLEIINSEIVAPQVAGAMGVAESAFNGISTAGRPYSTVGRSIPGSCRNIHWTRFSISL
jgi:hypothetical protein